MMRVTSLRLYKYCMNKIEKFIKRNLRRNAHLYDDALIEGIDYVVCPVTNARLSMIKKSYIEKVLCMTVDEYDTAYPDVKKICDKRVSNIKNGLHAVDPTTGLTKYEISQIKAKEKLSMVGDDGLSGYARKGLKTKSTHMSNIDEHGRNGYRRQADYRMTTVLESGLTVEQNAHIKRRETLLRTNKAGNGGASMLSIRVLRPILKLLQAHDVKYYFDDREYGIKDTDTGKFYFWDLTIPDFKMAIEYQSIAWHADPTMTEDEWNAWAPPLGEKKTANEVLDYDYNKARALFNHRGYRTYYVWQKSQDRDVEELLCLLKTLITKY